MPLYEYTCSACGNKFELLRKFGEAGEDVACPHCKGKAKRVLSVVACFARDSSGLASSIGGSSCGSCATPSSCST
ncbi:MAG: zinc ribbon domain-containing protein [Chloroflexota bacterium]